MGFFNFMKKPFKEISGGAWGHLVGMHKMDVDTLSREFRCVERQGMREGKELVTFIRVFKPSEAEARNIKVTGWETFDQYPDLIYFEGYITADNEAKLIRIRQ